MRIYGNKAAVERQEHTCVTCGSRMVSRRTLSLMGEAERQGVRAHAAKGVCRLCDSVARRQAKQAMPKVSLIHPGRRKITAEQVEREYRKSEWAWLKSFGTAPEHAAPRLGVSVDTILEYDAELRGVKH